MIGIWSSFSMIRPLPCRWRYERSAQRGDLGYAGAVNQMNQKNSELSREAEQMKETVVMDRTDVRTTIFLLLFVPWKTAE